MVLIHLGVRGRALDHPSGRREVGSGCLRMQPVANGYANSDMSHQYSPSAHQLALRSAAINDVTTDHSDLSPCSRTCAGSSKRPSRGRFGSFEVVARGKRVKTATWATNIGYHRNSCTSLRRSKRRYAIGLIFVSHHWCGQELSPVVVMCHAGGQEVKGRLDQWTESVCA